jgi:hypothetical protein
LLDARPLDRRVRRQPVAIVSPCDGTIEALDPNIVIRSSDGRCVQLRRPAMSYIDVRVGDIVHAGVEANLVLEDGFWSRIPEWSTIRYLDTPATSGEPL